jgi:hypothetical protein
MTTARGDTVAREIARGGRSARFVAADLLDKREVARLMDEALWGSAQALKSTP